MKNFVSMPHVMGHEVIAEVVAVGPEAEGLEPGDRVALNPWLTCVTRGVSPVCPACEAGDLSQCHSFGKGSFAPGIHIGMCADVNGGFADLMPAHDSMLFKVPDDLSDEQVVVADPFAVSLHAVTRHPPQPGSKVLVYGAGALGQCAVAILQALYPTVEVMVVARFDAQRRLAEAFGASTVPHEPRLELIERVADWSGGVLQPADGLPMAFPGGIDVVYDTIGAAETLEVGCRVLRARGTLVKLGMHGAAKWDDTPVYCQGDHLHRFQRLRDRGGRGRASARHRPLPGHGRIRPDRPDTDAHPHLPPRRVARRLRRAGRPGDVRGHQGRHRQPLGRGLRPQPGPPEPIGGLNRSAGRPPSSPGWCSCPGRPGRLPDTPRGEIRA